MSILSRITTGKIKAPFLSIVYGPDGSGKTTLASTMPGVLIMGSEKGSKNINVPRLDDIKTLKQLKDDLQNLKTEKHEFTSVALDSLDWLEPLIWEHVCKENGWASIETPGYGKGYVEALNQWRELIKIFEMLRDEKGMNVMLLAHSQIKATNDPRFEVPYDRYTLKLNEKAAGVLREFVDAVLFMNTEAFVEKDKANKSKGKAFGDPDKRLVFTQRTVAYDAKNRTNLPHEIEIPKENGFQVILDAYNAFFDAPPQVDNLLASAKALAEQVKDEKVKRKALDQIESSSGDAVKLQKILKRLQEIVK